MLNVLNSLEEWENYASQTKEISTPLCWPSRIIPYSLQGKFLTAEKEVIQ